MIGWQVLTTTGGVAEAAPLDVGTGDAIAIENAVDLGVPDMQVDTTVGSVAPLPAAGGQLSWSALARAQNDGPAAAETCYCASWDFLANNTGRVTLLKFLAGVATILGQWTAGVVVPSAGHTISCKPVGSTIQALIDGTPVTGASVTDTSITAGNFFGMHIFRNVVQRMTISNCAGVAVSGGAGGGGGGSGGPVITSRAAKLWPGDATCAVNIPFGDATGFSTHVINFGADNQFIQTTAFGMSIYGAGYTPLAQTSTEHHTVHVNADQVTAFDGYGGSDTTPNIKSANYSLKMANLNDGHQGMVFTNMGACGWAHSLGIVREADIAQGYIGHAVMFALINAELNRSQPFVAPAYRGDGDAASTYSTTGTLSIGMRLGIPWNVTKPTLTSTIGPLLWDALKTFGGFVSNRAGNGFIYFEATTQMVTWANQFIASGDIPLIKAAIRPTTNVSAANQFAGPVTTARRPATLPPFSL